MQDFTFVCPTEIIAFSERSKQFEQLNCQLIAASCDTEETHLAWIKTPRKKGGLGIMQIPILADTTKVPALAFPCVICRHALFSAGAPHSPNMLLMAGVLAHTWHKSASTACSLLSTIILQPCIQLVCDNLVVVGSKHNGCHSTIKCGKVINVTMSWTANVVRNLEFCTQKSKSGRRPSTPACKCALRGVMQHFTGRLPDFELLCGCVHSSPQQCRGYGMLIHL